MPLFKRVDGERVPMTAAEEAAFNREQDRDRQDKSLEVLEQSKVRDRINRTIETMAQRLGLDPEHVREVVGRKD